MGCLGLLTATGCDGSSRKAAPMDPVERSVGTFERAGDTLIVSTSGLHCCGENIKLKSSLVRDGEKASFSEGLVKEGFIFDDTCSGSIKPTESGIEVDVSGDSRCDKFKGAWTHDTGSRIGEAKKLMARLAFSEAVDRLQSVNKGDVNGGQVAKNLLTSEEMKFGLAWVSSRNNVEKATESMIALLNVAGVSAPAGQMWLARHADEACNAKAPRSACKALVAGVRGKAWTDDFQSSFHRVTEATGRRWLAEAAKSEYSPKADEALALLEDVCVLDEKALCEQAQGRAAGIRLRSAQREVALGHFLAARKLLEQVKTSGHAASQAQAQILLASSAFTGGTALEEADNLRRERGVSDEVIDAYESVCGSGGTTPACLQARQKAAGMNLELGQAALKRGQYVAAQKRLAAVVAHGGATAAMAKPILDSPSFREGFRAETIRNAAQAAISQCKEGMRDCEAVAQTALKYMGASPMADEVTSALTRFRTAAAGSADAVTRTEALIGRCGIVVKASALTDACFPPKVKFDASGKPKPPSYLERAVLSVSNVLFGDEPSTGRANAAFALICALMGGSLRMFLSMARQGRAAGGALMVLLAVAGLGAIVKHGLPNVGRHLDNVGIVSAP